MVLIFSFLGFFASRFPFCSPLGIPVSLLLDQFVQMHFGLVLSEMSVKPIAGWAAIGEALRQRSKGPRKWVPRSEARGIL